MRGQKNLLHNLGVLSGTQVLAQLLNLAVLVYLARTLGSHWFGVLQIAATVSFYALIAAEWGLFSLGIREVARLDRPAEVRRYSSLHVGLLLPQGVIVLLLGILILPRFPTFAEDPWILILYCLVVVPQIFMYDWIGIGLEQMTWVGIVKSCRSLVYALLVFPLLGLLDGWLGWPAQRWVPLLFLISIFAVNTVMALKVKRWLGGAVRPRYGGWPEWRERLSQTAPIGASNLTARVVIGVDVIILGLLAAPEVAGSYSAAAKILLVLVVAIEVLWKAFLPKLSRLWRESRELFRDRFNLYLGLIAAGFLPVAAGGYTVGERFMADLYGEAFSGAGPVFQILSVSYVFLSLGLFFSRTLIACDRQQACFPAVLGSALVAVGGNLLLVPENGALGACWAMLLSHSLFFFWTGWLCRRLLARQLLRPVAASLLAAAVMVLVLRFLPDWHSAVMIAAGVGVYGLLAGPVVVAWTRRQMG